MSEINRLVTLADNQDRHKLSDEFALESLALECLRKLIFDIVPCIATLTFYQFCIKLAIIGKNHQISNAFKIVQFSSELVILEC